jgi:uncharacterized LabA/DUF88 family protein
MPVYQAQIQRIICYVYVDGGYVRRHLTDEGLPGEFDPSKPASVVVGHIAGRALALGRVFYYDAINEGGSPTEQVDQQNYLRRVERLNDTHVQTGYIRPGRRTRRQQKGVDVQLAVDALEAAWSGNAAAIGLVAGDGDFAPLADAIRRAGPHVLVLGFEKSLSSELVDSADRVIHLPEHPTDWQLPAIQT